MPENVSFNEQEQHILINNNVREDGTPINDKIMIEQLQTTTKRR